MKACDPRRPGRGPDPRRARAGILALALLAALPGHADPLRVDYTLGLSLLHSDNIDLNDAASRSETMLSPNLTFEATQSGSVTSLKARGQLQYLHYFENTYDDEARGEFAGQFRWTPLPERLSFVVEDYLGRQPIDFTAGYSPGNQQQVNVFTAGPSLFARFGDAMRAQLDVRYSDTYAERTREFNGKRYLAAGRLFRDLGPRRWLSANVEASRVRFDIDGANNDYDRYDAYMGYRQESKRLALDVALGYTRLDQTGTALDRDSSPLARAQLEWQLAPRSMLTGRASYQFADTASDLVSESSRLDALAIEDVSGNAGLVGASLYRQRRYEVDYHYTGDRWDIRARPYLERVDYDRTLQLAGWKSHGAYVDVEYRLRPRLSLVATAAREQREFDDGSRDDTDSVARVGMAYAFSRHLSGAVALQRRVRNSSLAGQDYHENVATVSLSYRR